MEQEVPRIEIPQDDIERMGAVPDDDYVGVLNGVTLENGDKGDYLRWEFEIIEGEYSKKKAWRNTPIAGDGVVYLAQLLSAFVDGGEDEVKKLMAKGFQPMDFVGTTVKFTTQQREFEGNMRHDIVGFKKY